MVVANSIMIQFFRLQEDRATVETDLSVCKRLDGRAELDNLLCPLCNLPCR